MSTTRHRIATALMALGAAVLPAAQHEWLRAMRAEAAHLVDRDVLGFAAGCLFACAAERLRFMANLPAPARQGLIGGLLLCAAFTALSGLRMVDEQPLTASVFGGVAASYVLAALWSVLRGGNGLIQAGLLLLSLNLVAAACLSWRVMAEVPALDTTLISAVAIEGTAIWLTVLGICLLCARSVAPNP